VIERSQDSLSFNDAATIMPKYGTGSNTCLYKDSTGYYRLHIASVTTGDAYIKIVRIDYPVELQGIKIISKSCNRVYHC